MSGTDRTSERQQKFLGQLAKGLSIASGCDAALIARSTAYRWRDESPEFAAAWDAAIETGTDRLEDIAQKRAEDSSDTLTIFLLKARRAAKYAGAVTTVRVTGKDDDTPVRMAVEDGRRSVDEFMGEFLAAKVVPEGEEE